MFSMFSSHALQESFHVNTGWGKKSNLVEFWTLQRQDLTFLGGTSAELNIIASNVPSEREYNISLCIELNMNKFDFKGWF